jgi:hypothetical protein
MNDVVDTSYILYTRRKDFTGIVGPKSHEKFKIEAGSYDFILKTTDGRLLTSVKADVTKKGKVRAYKFYTLLGGTPYVEYKE